ncbi:MGMT family protein [Oceanobacillus sojae]|uniref:MGMT family protein n=1 Tax=Oceanobacillus sojae TaxID=582851 RepID=UPI00098893FA|nr:MGMT family protein [Oceanobacillus sojae]MCT1901355.1 MGMT family protein [Oceanobacillus sojae]
MTPFTQEVIKIIQQIPSGKVMTYGQIAREAGNPRAARQVVRVLHSMSRKHNLPWHRVINAKGQLAIPNEEANWEQRTRLEEEDIEVSSAGRVNLKEYQWIPD